MNKYIKTDLEQAKAFQVSALNNILAAIENGEKIEEMDISIISLNIINKVCRERYGTLNVDFTDGTILYINGKNFTIGIDPYEGDKEIWTLN